MLLLYKATPLLVALFQIQVAANLSQRVITFLLKAWRGENAGQLSQNVSADETGGRGVGGYGGMTIPQPSQREPVSAQREEQNKVVKAKKIEKLEIELLNLVMIPDLFLEKVFPEVQAGKVENTSPRNQSEKTPA